MTARIIHTAILSLFLPAVLCYGQASPKPESPGIPRTPEGHPNLQGIWSSTTMTPLERPAVFAGKATITDAEARAYEKGDHKDDPPEKDASAGEVALVKAQKAVGALDSDFWEDGAELARVNGVKRTSLIIDPPDGKIPARTPEGKQRFMAFFDSFNQYGGYRERPLSERCLPDSEVPMTPAGANDNYQIVQTATAVMILSEMIHDARIIRIGGRHPSPDVRLWLGDSIGHWEGDTLVVDTTNFNAPLSSLGATAALHVTERFSRIDGRTILYRATVEDSSTFTRPWTVEFPLLSTTQTIFEYACHEGNRALVNVLTSARK